MITRYLCLLSLFLISVPAFSQEKQAASQPLKILLVAGGCCHDYAGQTKALKEGIESRINAVVTVEYNSSKGTNTRFDIYKSDDWAKGFDVILHDECSASVTEKEYVNRILAAHKSGIPAVNLHCAMHSYRWGDFRSPVKDGADNAGWYETIGLQSTSHGPQSPIVVKFSDQKNPITKGMQDWTTINEELYNNIRVMSTATAIASGTQTQAPRKRDLKKNPNAKPKNATAVVAWTNLYGPNKTPIFSTSLGHNTETVKDARYLELVIRGILWTTGNLTEDGKPKAAYAK